MSIDLNITIQACFVNEMELLMTYRGTPQPPSKGNKGRAKSTSESELVFDIMEQIAPILIKTMTTAMNAVMKSLLTSDNRKIVKLEERIDSLEMEANKREQYSRRPNLRFQGIPEKPDEVTNQLIIDTISQTMGLTNSRSVIASARRRTGKNNRENARLSFVSVARRSEIVSSVLEAI